MTIGTNDKKKMWFLIALGVLAAYMVYSNLLSGPGSGSQNRGQGPGAVGRGSGSTADLDVPATGGGAPAAAPMQPDIRRAAPLGRGRAGEEFRPVLRSKRKEDNIDARDIDPTLRTDLLAKVQAVKLEGGQRNLFQFGSAQPVDPADLKGKEPVVAVARPAFVFPKPLPEKPPETATTPTPEPPLTIPYKYYGLSTTRINGKKTAFFLDGEEIILANEGTVIKKRYRVVRIGPTSVQMEEVDSKRQATLIYTEDAPNASGG